MSPFASCWPAGGAGVAAASWRFSLLLVLLCLAPLLGAPRTPVPGSDAGGCLDDAVCLGGRPAEGWRGEGWRASKSLNLAHSENLIQKGCSCSLHTQCCAVSMPFLLSSATLSVETGPLGSLFSRLWFADGWFNGQRDKSANAQEDVIWYPTPSSS